MYVYRKHQKIKVIKLRFMFWAIGMSLYPYIFINRKYWNTSSHDARARLLEHEFIHWHQQAKRGLFKWLLSYIKYWFKYGYEGHPDEELARTLTKTNHKLYEIWHY